MNQFKIVTWNIFKDGTENNLRLKEILKQVDLQDPDIIALQEVTVFMLNGFLQSPVIQGKYYSYYDNGSSILPYGVVFFSKSPFHSIVTYQLPSELERRVLVGKMRLSGKYELCVCTTHLESSLDAKEMRAAQLSRIMEITKELEGEAKQIGIVVGDYNAFSFSERAQQLKRCVGYSDVWLQVHGKTGGGTCCGDRLDMIFYKSPQNILQPLSVSTFGEEAITKGLTASDHLGLCAIFEFST
eukprot:TRINITY_DN17774_c0_g1_i2.p1 TRINITY_DN17774_c0_g1~~TRINITY_DN17774_c0_g1_i2.p1  ORF type:complete len:242 (-),score=65.01 TRINITY_DN17774_c0_g1_i2:8-733(-)